MVKEEYKTTDSSFIPKDWHRGIFGNLCKVFRGGSPRPIQAYITSDIDGVNWIKIGDVKEGEKYITSTEEKIKRTGISRSRTVHVGDFILSNSMSFGRPYILKIDGCIHDGWLTVQDYQDSFDIDFLYYLLGSKPILRQYISMAAGSSVKNLNKEKVNSLTVFYPDKPEQRLIAEALSDIDELISIIKKLFIKKKNIKQGSMQELLSGKKRLPGYSKAWIIKRIGDMAVVSSGGTPDTARPEFWGGSIKWMNSGELNKKMIFDVEGRITEAGLRSSSTHLIPKYCTLIGLAGQGKTRGTAAYNHVELCTNQSIAAIYPNDKQFDSLFMYYLMDSKYTDLREASSGDGGRGGLTKKILQNFYISMPVDISEQHEIANILYDMDKEILALSSKLLKYQQLKQGMMQKLLTGEIRLI